jgi:hypothetical protein
MVLRPTCPSSRQVPTNVRTTTWLSQESPRGGCGCGRLPCWSASLLSPLRGHELFLIRPPTAFPGRACAPDHGCGSGTYLRSSSHPIGGPMTGPGRPNDRQRRPGRPYVSSGSPLSGFAVVIRSAHWNSAIYAESHTRRAAMGIRGRSDRNSTDAEIRDGECHFPPTSCHGTARKRHDFG